MFKKISAALTVAAIMFTIGACAKKPKLAAGATPSDPRLVAFQGEWKSDECKVGADGSMQHLLTISGDKVQPYTNYFNDLQCNNFSGENLGDHFDIKIDGDNLARFVDGAGTHLLSIENGTTLEDALTNTSYVK